MGLPLPLKQHSSAGIVLLAGRQAGASPGTDTDIKACTLTRWLLEAALLRIASPDRDEFLENKPVSRTSLHREQSV